MLQNLPSVKQVKNLVKTDVQPDVEHAEFLTKESYYSVFPEPTPSSKDLPSWYRNLDMYQKRDNGDKIKHMTTARACAPLLEGMTNGWLLTTPVDISFYKKGEHIEVDFGPRGELDFNPVDAQDSEEFGGEKNIPEQFDTIIQFQTPWVISVPDGYSLFQLPLLNRWEYKAYDFFYPFSGMRDVDSLFSTVNSTGFLQLDNGDNIRIEAGTPISQFLIIDRSSFISTASSRPMNEDEKLDYDRAAHGKLRNSSRYREEIWNPIPSSRNVNRNSASCPFFDDKDE